MRKTVILAIAVSMMLTAPAFAFGVGNGSDNNSNSNSNTNKNTVNVAPSVTNKNRAVSSSNSSNRNRINLSQDASNRNKVTVSPDITVDPTMINRNKQGQLQGQKQGQLQGQKQGQGQAQKGIVRNDLNIEGDDILYEAPDIPVNSAAPVFAGSCAQGVSAQTHGFGGSVASGNPVCDYVAVAGGLVAAGERGEAVRVLGKAEKAADWRFRMTKIRNIFTLGLF